MTPSTGLWLVALTVTAAAPPKAPEAEVTFTARDDRLDISVGGRPFAAYVFKDDKIPRPYLAHVHTPKGVPITRNHPPVEGKDPTDHADLHPGLWLAFGDLSGADFWRNKAAVKHVEFVGKPKGGKTGRFAVRNRYEAGGKTLCEEVCTITVLPRPAGHLLLWDSEFTSDRDFSFGDQEEMGLGVRLATPLAVKNGGRIVNSDGLKNEGAVWGKPADWCAYHGEAGGKRAGVLLMPDPRNFRRSWFHARDYGLLVANPFGRKAFTKGEPSKVAVKKGEAFRLRFGVLFHDGRPDPKAAYRDYLDAAGVPPAGGAKK
jgi:hypothetical protein